MTKKKSIIIIIAISLLVIGALVYSGLWFYYYNVVCLPNMPAESYGVTIYGSSKYDTSGTNEGQYSEYLFRIPQFGNFHCSYHTHVDVKKPNADSIVIPTPVPDENGITPRNNYCPYYSVSMVAPLGMNGKYNNYSISISDGVASGAYFKLDSNGEFLNPDEVSEYGVQLYNETRTAIFEFIDSVEMLSNSQ